MTTISSTVLKMASGPAVEGLKTFNSMLDQEYATALSQRESLGIADALVRQFQHRVSDGDV